MFASRVFGVVASHFCLCYPQQAYIHARVEGDLLVYIEQDCDNSGLLNRTLGSEDDVAKMKMMKLGNTVDLQVTRVMKSYMDQPPCFLGMMRALPNWDLTILKDQS